MTKEQVSALLGRPLTSIEDANFDLYIEIATQALEELICSSTKCQYDTRVFNVRDNYSTVWTDIFTGISEVKLNGTVLDEKDYSPRQGDKRNAKWYNSIVLNSRCHSGELEVSGTFGLKLPSDLQLVLAGLFGLITKKNKFDATVTSKKVRNFSYTIDTSADLDAEFTKLYSKTLAKYSVCDKTYILHGGC